MTSPPPDWATRVPFAPVQQPPAKAFQARQLSAQQAQAMQQQLLESVFQGFLKIVDGFLLPDTAANDQLAAWWADLQTTLNGFGTAISKSLMTFQQLVNGVVVTAESDVTDLITALNATATNATNAQAAWVHVFTDLGFSVTDATTYVTWLQSLETDIGLAITTGDFTPLLQLLFGSGTTTVPTSGTPIAVAAVPGLPTSKITSGQFAATLIAGILGGASLSTDLTNLSNWLWGTTTPASTIQIQASVVPGVQGFTDIGATIQTMWDNFANSIASALGLTGIVSSGNSLSALTGAVQSHAQATSTALDTAQTAAMVQAQQATAKPGYMAIDATMDAVFPLSHMIAAPTYNNVIASSSTVGFIRTSDNVAKQAVAWLGSYTGTLTGLYINIYSMNTSTGVLTNVVAGANIIGSVGTGLGWNYYDLPSAITAAPGNVYAVEMLVVGSGTYSLMGLANSTFPTNAAVFPQALGAFRTTTPAHDATGAGSFTSALATSFSWSHTLGASAAGILIEFVASTTVSTVKVGTTSATLLGSKTLGGGQSTYVYELLSPPTGAQTITVTFTGSTSLLGNSDSYTGVSSFGTVATNSGASAGTASVSVSSAPGQTAVAVIGSASASALTAFNQTSRWNNGNATAGSFGVFGDAAGAGTVNFQATAGAAWAAVGVSLIGAPTVTPPGTISSPTYSTNVPWFGLGNTAVTTSPIFTPVTTAYLTAGTYSLTVPTWVNFIDGITVGGGGGGGGGINGAGSNGSSSTITIGSHTVTATGGTGGPGGTTTLANSYGQTPGNEIYLGTTYYGGSQVYYAQNGSSPGGGGGAGYYAGLVGWGGIGGAWSANTYAASGVTTVSITVGAGGAPNTFGSPSYGACPGAAGGAWVVFRQS